ncbi:LuxR C-terminal-related transcriptional regulator [Pseudonocardia sp. NPDC049635]|uniref:ATP-binding protein n=1 Tax=Pseudonocardia sp. NPDC049635 TaxID=3155506 RepID=UPI0033F49A21
MPPPASSPSTGRLPVGVTRFVGRRRELADARRLLTSTSLVTLTGVGGVGKTRMAVKLAADSERTFQHGVCFVPLAELRDPGLLGHAVAEALGLREGSGEWHVETLTSYLAEKRLLLVLDNCEHQLDACAELVDQLLSACPRLQVLATSREPLMLAGESILVIPPMSTPGPECRQLSALPQYDAVNLFLDRAASALPSFTLTQENHLAVAGLCHALDGLPLALELAAVRLRALSPEQILDRLTSRYSLLTTGSRNAPARQQTLRALIAWSYDLCSPDEQLLWARLSVFSGGIELDAAEGVCSDERLPRESILDLLASLVDKSILIREDHGAQVRYRLLETIRQFGAEKLSEAGEWRTQRLRHRDFYAGLIEGIFTDWIGPGQVERFARLRRDHANIRAALELCVSVPSESGTGLHMAATLYYYWITRGLLGEGRHWLGQLLRAGDPLRPGRVRPLCVAASLAVLQEGATGGSELLDEAERIAQHSGDTADLALVTQGRALAAIFADDLPRAITLFDESLRQLEHSTDRGSECSTLILLGLARVLAGEFAGSAEAHRRCRELTRPHGESWAWSYALWVAGLQAWRQGDHDLAERSVEASLEMKETFDDRLGIAECLEALACVAASGRAHERAATLLGAADSIWQAIGFSLANFPGLRRYHDQCVRSARRIGERPFTAAFRRGTQMTLAEAVRFALGRREPAGGADAAGPQPAEPIAALTPREAQIAELVSEGMTNREIAERLGVSRRTVEAHVEHALAKLGFTSRTQIVAWVVGRRQSPQAVGGT